MKRRGFILLIALALAVVVMIAGFYQISIDALEEPGRLETILATWAKHLLIHRTSRKGIPTAPIDLPASIEEGDRLFGLSVHSVMVSMATRQLTPDVGCIRAPRI